MVVVRGGLRGHGLLAQLTRAAAAGAALGAVEVTLAALRQRRPAQLRARHAGERRDERGLVQPPRRALQAA